MPGARIASGDRVTLRTVEREDLPSLQRAHANPELRYPLGWDVKTRAQLEEEFDDGVGTDELFLVCLERDDASPGRPDQDDVRRVGCVLASPHERARTGIGCWLVPGVHGEGYATEAVSLVLDYVFRVYPHPAVHTKTLPHNGAARGLLESLGFSQEGRLRKEAFWDGECRDSIQYSLLRSERQESD